MPAIFRGFMADRKIAGDLMEKSELFELEFSVVLVHGGNGSVFSMYSAQISW